MMRATITIMVILNIVGSLFPMIIYAQSMVPAVINSSGNNFSNNSYNIQYSIGEPITTTIFDDNTIFTQGFLQPELNIERVIEEICLEDAVFVYPNPTYDQVFIKSGCNKIKSFRLLDLLGRVLIWKDWTGQPVELKEFPPSAYVIQLFDEKNSLIRSVQVIKKI